MSGFTFKQYVHTGRWKSFELWERWDIKLNGGVVGEIVGNNVTVIQPKFYRIRFKVCKKDIMEDKNPNCEWKWVLLKYPATSFQDAKDFVIKHSKLIQQQFKLYTET